MKTANLEGVNLEFESSGTGEPVILIHGSVVADAHLPLMTQRSLAHRYQLVRYRRRGYAGSTHCASPVSIEDQAGDCRALMRNLGIAKAHIVGHSYGGVIAACLAIAAPDMVQSLALLEPAFVWMVPSERSALAAAALEKYQAGDKRAALDSFMLGVSGPNYRDELERVIPGSFEAAVADVDTFFQIEMPAMMKFGESFTSGDLRRIRQPVLALVGRNSVPLFPEIHDMVLKAIAQAEGQEIPAAGHMLQMENPTAVAEGLVGFFARHPIQ